MSPNQLNFALGRARALLGTAVLLTFAVHFAHQAATAQDNQIIYLPIITSPGPFVHGINRLPNPSFEAGWYHPDDIPELQIPEGWVFTWQTGPTGFGNEPWDIWVRPEVRVLPSEQLPPHEHPLFIWDGNQTVKSFKASGAISFQMTTNVTLEPGKYVFEMSVFPDLIVGYNPDGSKIWAPDPLSGEVKFAAGNSATDWVLPTFGQKNTFYYVFIITQTQTIPISAAMRGRYAILNNGWFMDDWWLWQQDDLPLPPGVYTEWGAPALFAANYVPPVTPYTFPVGRPAAGIDE